MTTVFWLQLLRVVHIYSAIMLVESIVFNTAILNPALKRIPPAHSTVVSQKIGAGLMIVGTTAILLLGITGFTRLWLMGQLPRLFTSDFVTGPYGHWIVLMALSWFVLLITGSLSGYWYQAVLTKKLPYSAGLLDASPSYLAFQRHRQRSQGIAPSAAAGPTLSLFGQTMPQRDAENGLTLHLEYTIAAGTFVRWYPPATDPANRPKRK